ncbi:hypothetical protein L596_029293 [Steinernema carpocapsae]|uniref:Uncharacterized protein n=1 Tax=Steinernema carpocapsae TaxID=34508 RepID=A0A4U5LU79_STECR|nr:hypothetical protein L596_029293 [Steinernema carpocapsae]
MTNPTRNVSSTKSKGLTMHDVQNLRQRYRQLSTNAQKKPISSGSGGRHKAQSKPSLKDDDTEFEKVDTVNRPAYTRIRNRNRSLSAGPRDDKTLKNSAMLRRESAAADEKRRLVRHQAIFTGDKGIKVRRPVSPSRGTSLTPSGSGRSGTKAGAAKAVGKIPPKTSSKRRKSSKRGEKAPKGSAEVPTQEEHGVEEFNLSDPGAHALTRRKPSPNSQVRRSSHQSANSRELSCHASSSGSSSCTKSGSCRTG